MAERSATSNEMFWAFLWWLAALVAGLVVFAVLWMFNPDDPGAGLIFGGVTFVIVGLLLVYFGPGPAATPAVPEVYARQHPAPHAEPVPEPVIAPAPPAEPVPPVAEPAAEAAPPGAGISERVRDAARAAGEAARAAVGDMSPADPTARPAPLAAPLEGRADDLKKIKGVGPKLEELLHSLGIYHFQQIARWGPAEVGWMDSNLEGFVGRVTRDDWVGQAKLLASGGETEFSQSVDKGEVH